MYTVTNRIKVKKGMGQKMAPLFTSGKELLEFEGFHKVEVHVSTQHEEYDEMNVMMYWDALAHFEHWRASDSFKKAHARDAGNGHGASPVISNQVVISELVSTLSE